MGFGRPRPPLAFLVAIVVTSTLLGACATRTTGGNGVRVVASFYPLAWAAERAGGTRVDVTDLTPPGTEAHDTSLNARSRSDVQEADIVVILGYDGFQPDVEDAARQTRGRVILATDGLKLRPSSERGLSADPHVWLDPTLMSRIVGSIGSALAAVDPGGRADYERHTRDTQSALGSLDGRYRSDLGDCRYRTLITTHEAFGYLADRYGLEQLGVTGLTPESEPSADRLRAAADTVRAGKAGAVFYEETDEGARIGRSVAGDLGVPAYPLGTLESEPRSGDYLTVMNANLESLRKGLACH